VIVQLWSTLEDPHIVSLYGICLKPQLSIITEVFIIWFEKTKYKFLNSFVFQKIKKICSRGNLLSLMHQSTLNLHWQTCLTWSMQVSFKPKTFFFFCSNFH